MYFKGGRKFRGLGDTCERPRRLHRAYLPCHAILDIPRNSFIELHPHQMWDLVATRCETFLILEFVSSVVLCGYGRVRAAPCVRLVSFNTSDVFHVRVYALVEALHCRCKYFSFAAEWVLNPLLFFVV